MLSPVDDAEDGKSGQSVLVQNADNVDDDSSGSVGSSSRGGRPTHGTIIEMEIGDDKSRILPPDMDECCIDGDVPDSLKAIGVSEVDAAVKNTFASTKGLAEGMMDIALLTANANQLRFLITYNMESKTFFISVGLIITSLILQIAVGIALIFKWLRRWSYRVVPNSVYGSSYGR